MKTDDIRTVSDINETINKLKEAKWDESTNSCYIGKTELDVSIKALEKVSRLKDLAKEIKAYDETLFMYEGDRIDLSMLKDEVFEIIQEL